MVTTGASSVTDTMQRVHPSRTGPACTHASPTRNDAWLRAAPTMRAVRATRPRSMSGAEPPKRTTCPSGEMSAAAPVAAAYSMTWGARMRARSVRNGEGPPSVQP